VNRQFTPPSPPQNSEQARWGNNLPATRLKLWGKLPFLGVPAPTRQGTGYFVGENDFIARTQPQVLLMDCAESSGFDASSILYRIEKTQLSYGLYFHTSVGS
jgi:hypothetical protein